jgi:uncharacterized metal-binding protein
VENNQCSCSRAPTLVFPCSGGADVGAISDLAARRLTELAVGRMFCLAGVGGRVSGILRSTEAADQILAIDGCSLDCARKTLEKASFMDFSHLRVTDLGLAKGASPPSPGSIGLVVRAAQRALGVASTTALSVDDQQGSRRSETPTAGVSRRSSFCSGDQ